MSETWQCPDCTTRVHLHSDPDHASHDWTSDFIREHEYVHAEHLKTHGDDRAMMRLALKYPALHAAIIQVHGPIDDLTAEHRAQILCSAGIEEATTQRVPPSMAAQSSNRKETANGRHPVERRIGMASAR